MGLANIIVKPFWIVFIILATRYLGSEQFGAFMYLMVISIIVSSFFELGLDLQIVRYVSPDKDNIADYTRKSLLIRSVGTIGLFLLLLSLHKILYSETFLLHVFIAGTSIGILLFNIIHFRAIYRSLEVLKYEAISIIIEKFSVILLCGIVLFNDGSLFVFLLCYSFGLFITLVVDIIFLVRLNAIKNLGWISFKECFLFLKPALPFAFLNILQVTYTRLGTVTLEGVSSDLKAVGHFNAGSRFTESFAVFPNMLVSVMYPVFCRVFRDIESMWRLILLSTRTLLALAVPIGSTIFIASYEFTDLLFGSDYIVASPTIGIFGLTLIVTSQVYIFGSVVSSSGRQPIVNRYLWILVCISLASYLIFIPIFGIIAAAVITFLDQLFLGLINYWAAREYYKNRVYLIILLKSSVFPIIAWMAYSYLDNPLSDLETLVLISLWSMAGVFITRVVSVADIRYFISIIKRKS